MFKFFKSVKEEMKKVTWPTAKQNRRDTAIVVGASILFGLYLGALDWLFTSLTQLVM